jgi:hypothetical protein
MKNLMPFAEVLAKEPPVVIYKRMQRLLADEVARVEKEDATYIAEVFESNVKELGLKTATYIVGAICDLTAMCMMMVAAGVPRIEKMKAALTKTAHDNRAAVKNQQPVKTGLVWEDKDLGDHAYLYDKNSSDKFEKVLQDWCILKGNGVVQFKFDAEGDWHTFTVERVQDKDTPPVFLVYQSYQNIYRLLDFLGMGDQSDQAAHNSAAFPVPSTWKNNKKKQNDIAKGRQEFADKALKRIESTAGLIGRKQALSLKTFESRVLQPLTAMVAGQISNSDYVLLTASATDKAQVGITHSMGVMMCDTVLPEKFEGNLTDLLKPHADLTPYAECG